MPASSSILCRYTAAVVVILFAILSILLSGNFGFGIRIVMDVFVCVGASIESMFDVTVGGIL